MQSGPGPWAPAFGVADHTPWPATVPADAPSRKQRVGWAVNCPFYPGSGETRGRVERALGPG